MLVSALLGAPSAAAGPLGLVAETPVDVLDVAVPEASVNAETLAPAADALATVDHLLDCQSAVRLPVTLFGGNAVDHRDNGLDVLVTVETLLNEVIEQVPVYGQVEQVIWQGDGLLSALPAITRTVTEVIGYEDEVVETEVADLDYNVLIDWKETQISWTRIDLELILDLPVGLGFLYEGLGELIVECDEEPLATLPDFDALDGYEYVQVHLGGADHDSYTAWYKQVLSVDVSLAEPEDHHKQRLDNLRLLVCPVDALDRADAGIAAIQDAILRGDIDVRSSSVHGASPEPEAATPQSAGATSVGASTLGIVAAAALAVAGAVLALRRRF